MSFVAQCGKSVTPDGGEMWSYVEESNADEAEKKVLANPDKYMGYVECDDEGWVFLAYRGARVYDQDGLTLHTYKADVHTADDVDLFEDDTGLCDSEASARPGRNEGILDGSDKLCLFESVSPSDLHQGSLGDCWLISAFAAVAEFPEKIMERFDQKTISQDGMYSISLFHPVDEQWNTYTVDDRIPTAWNAIKYVKATDDDEIWPCLLEKAFAAMVGDYQLLRGNSCCLGLKALTGATGDALQWFSSYDTHDGTWRCHWQEFMELPNPDMRHGNDQLSQGTWPDGTDGYESKSIEELIPILADFDRQNFLMCLCSHSRVDDTHVNEGGIVQGHAFTLIQVQANPAGSDVNLVQIRNPWGKQEWNGDWSDDSDKWDEYPEVKELLMPESADDGTFWMSVEDMAENYILIYVCKMNMGENRTKRELKAVMAEQQSGQPAMPKPVKKSMKARRAEKKPYNIRNIFPFNLFC
eukprot:gnl/MRDRNA2_/MRDRNA2_84870_c0_seq2.p1 gnl/MRDRNA2_/MRDRNA2_84870_c0~~gnl/MRDRNA2_/MRDRNA2_84870_c0_seq2.p1  ORF type:complete len:469 (+),score=86.21 gnl/MRDRNA2_/MRDRNA2_84870_c0_seq2:85-1491(+)